MKRKRVYNLANHVPNGSSEDEKLIVSARDLTAADARSLERQLADDSTNLLARLSLLGYYRYRDDKKSQDAYFVHALWMIDNRPSDYVCYYLAFGRQHQRAFGKVREHWLKQVRLHSRNAQVMGNAASVLFNTDRKNGEALFRRAQRLDPVEPRWTRRLAQYYRYMALNGPRACRPKYAKLCLKETDRALKLKDTLGEHVGLLTEHTLVAIEFGDFKRARLWAKELLSTGARYDFHVWTHPAHLYLARVEVAEQKIAQSKRRLRQVLKELLIEEHTHLHRDNRMMNLLNDLLHAGERQIVVDALTVCAKRCTSDDKKHRKQIEAWAKQIQSKRTPHLQFHTPWR